MRDYDGMRAMSHKEMDEIALRQAASMRNSGMNGDYLRGLQNMRDNIHSSQIDGACMTEERPAITIRKRIVNMFRKWTR